jgi:hypothetical protein
MKAPQYLTAILLPTLGAREADGREITGAFLRRLV